MARTPATARHLTDAVGLRRAHAAHAGPSGVGAAAEHALHGSHGDLRMLLWHVVAALVTAVLLHRGESIVLGSFALAARLFGALRRPVAAVSAPALVLPAPARILAVGVPVRPRAPRAVPHPSCGAARLWSWPPETSPTPSVAPPAALRSIILPGPDRPGRLPAHRALRTLTCPGPPCAFREDLSCPAPPVPRSTPMPVPSPAVPAALLRALLPATSRRALASLLVLPLAACSAGGADGGVGADGDDDSATGASDGGADAAASGSITVTDPWVKAADEGMTAAFGTVINGTGSDLVLTAVTTPATDMVQLHETTSDGSGGMSMQEKEGGFELPAGAELVLEPGGDHIMLMDLPEPLQPGDEIELTLVFSEGTEYPFTATVKDFTGAQEHYAPGRGR